MGAVFVREPPYLVFAEREVVWWCLLVSAVDIMIFT